MVDAFEEYKLFSETTHRLSERRQTATQTYLSVNTVIFTVLAFLAKDAGFRSWGLVGVSLPLFLVGIIACSVWLRILTNFERIIGWHYEQLRAMEQGLPGAHQVYTREWQTFYAPQSGKVRTVFSNLEASLPRMFIALYVVYAVGLMVAATLGLL